MYVVLAGRAWYFAASRVGTEAGDHQGSEPERGSLTAKRAKSAKKDPLFPSVVRDPIHMACFAVFASFAVKYSA